MRVHSLIGVALAALASAAAGPVEDALPAYARFAIAGLSGMTAWLVIHPGDVVKTRMQLAERGAPGAPKLRSAGPVAVAKAMVKDEGVASLYGGLSAALMRQATYTTLRLGLYDLFLKWTFDALAKQGKNSDAYQAAARLSVGAVSGAIASFLSNPIEVCLVRMQADGKLPAGKRRGYHNIFDALYRITKEEGLLTLWTGASTTMIRAMVVSITQISVYSQTKASLEGRFSGAALHTLAGLTAAFVFCTASMPFDNVKTRVQQAEKSSGAKLGTFSAIGKIGREEGIGALWNGYPPYLASKGLLTVLLFIIKEKYTTLAAQYLIKHPTEALK